MDAIVIAGPTASGKSGLAVRLAHRLGGAVVNADSMQVYDTLRILTARPAQEDMGGIAHHLYGHVSAGEAYSTGRWLADMKTTLDALRADGALPIIVGGTGLYFEALFGGLSQMPAIPDNVRSDWRARLAAEGAASLHTLLTARDPQTAATLSVNDGQRIVRALEVLTATGRSIRSFQRTSGQALLQPDRTRRLLLMPERNDLNAAIAARFAAMVDQGALEEVRALRSLHLDPALPVMKAIGVRELGDHIAGVASLADAIERSSAATRRYAKRQSTWFRNRFDAGWETVPGPDAIK
ncbi:tRNA (adenosine(37)-N6)-dimethylallyltransferase MiaA [Pararhizobium haloflavum]|uniref:tRNA (adenosine(37)-N6)-dimethylallyltransferase MiaA n=1 Tax=Pararhizobium haloflavum TaxID=2037914 RepID=UPI000C190F6E|nr:tRNA (adenosine(37)-N6)-dimethylallyltransferase MiaA [Pararhizobium haloflavum]